MIWKVKDAVQRDLSKSTRKIAQEAGTSHTTVRAILKKALELKPYKLSLPQEISPVDQEQRLAVSLWIREKLSDSPDFLQHLWPARSPDLTPLDFFLWGYLKSKVYANDPQDPKALKSAIKKEVRLISKETCQNVIREVQKRADLCLSRKGGLLEHVL